MHRDPVKFTAENWARTTAPGDVRGMAIVALAVMVGVVLFDAHELLNRRTTRR